MRKSFLSKLFSRRTLTKGAKRGLLENLESRLLLSTVAIGNATQTEGPGAVISFPITLSEASLTPITISYSTSPGDENPWAYDHNPGQIIIPAGNTSASIDLALNNDDVWNTDTHFTITIFSADADIPVPSASGSIFNDDPGHFQFVDVLTVTEGGSFSTAKLFVNDGPYPADLPVTVTKLPGSSNSINVPGSFTFHPAPNVGLSIVPTTDVDADQTNDSAQFQITAPGFAPLNFTVNETDTTPNAPDLVASSDTGASSSDNLTALNNSTAGKALQFSVGHTLVGAVVEILADGVVIGSANATGSTTLVTTNGSATLSDGSHAITARQYFAQQSDPAGSTALNITIAAGTPSLTVGDASAFEADGFIIFPVTLDKPSASDSTVYYFPTPGDAGFSDLDLTDGVITIPAGSTVGQFKIPITDDSAWEKDEQFYVSAFSGDVNVVNDFATGTIKNDDLLHFNFFPQLFVDEGQFLNNTKLRLMEFPSVDLAFTITKLPGGDPDIHTISNGIIHDSLGDLYALIVPSADEDADTENGSATFEITAAGAETYTFTITEIDNDTAVLTPDLNWFQLNMTPTSGPAGMQAELDTSYQVATQGVSQVNIKYVLSTNFVYGDGDDINLFTNSITGANQVTVGMHSVDNVAVTIPANTPVGTYHLLAKLDYNDQVAESNEDNNIAVGSDFTVTPPPQIFASSTNITVPEGGNNTFNVNLTTRPLANVTVNISRIGDADVTGDQTSLTFTPDNWDVPQTVTISAALDADTTSNAAKFKLAATGMTDVTVTATEDDITPLVPTNVVASDGQSNKVTVTWNPAGRASAYKLYRSQTNSFATATIVTSGSNIDDTTFDDNTAAHNKTYFYWVIGFNDMAAGAPSVSDSGIILDVGAATATSITVPKNTPFYQFGKSFKVVVKLKSTPASTKPFTGNIELLETSTLNVLSTGVIRGKSVTFTTLNMPVGSYTAFVRYDGDANHAPADSGDLNFIVVKSITTTTLKSSVAAPVFGQQVTLTSTVKSVTAPGTARPGTVTFYDGLVPLGAPVQLDGASTATFTFSTLTPGVHKFKAVYSGDPSFNISTSPALSRNIAKVKTAVSLVSSLPSPIAFLDPFDLTATVTDILPGASTPTGTITFRDNGKVLATVAIDNNGVAQVLGLSYPKAGSHRFTATYNGDVNDKLSIKALTLKILLIS